jgi:acyl-CoA thioester hydrolase
MAGVQQNITYSHELLAGDIVEVKSVLLEIRDKSIRFRHEMRNAETGEIAASCEITAVHLDRQARRAISFPDAVRKIAETQLVAAAPVAA